MPDARYYKLRGEGRVVVLAVLEGSESIPKIEDCIETGQLYPVHIKLKDGNNILKANMTVCEIDKEEYEERLRDARNN